MPTLPRTGLTVIEDAQKPWAPIWRSNDALLDDIVVLGPDGAGDGRLAAFDGTSGKDLKEVTGTGLLKITGGVPSVAQAGVDFCPKAPGSTLVKANGSGALVAAVAGVDYVAPGGGGGGGGDGVPVGTILDYAGAVAPAGFFLANGEYKDTSVYAALLAVVHPPFGAVNLSNNPISGALMVEFAAGVTPPVFGQPIYFAGSCPAPVVQYKVYTAVVAADGVSLFDENGDFLMWTANGTVTAYTTFGLVAADLARSEAGFKLPDLRGRAAFMQGSTPPALAILGRRVGNGSIVLTTANLPAHSHTVPIGAANGASKGLLSSTTLGIAENYGTSSVGTGTAVSILPLAFASNKIIKY